MVNSEKRFVSHLPGNSGNLVSLVNSESGPIVIKQGHDRHHDHAFVFDRLRDNGIPTPRILNFSPWHLTMEYIPGISACDYLVNSDPKPLINFLKHCLNLFKHHSIMKDFSRELDEKTRELEHMMPLDITLPIDLLDLRARLPDKLPWGLSHGDLSLENIIYYENKFYLIDCSGKDLTSWWLDAGKLGQDLDCGWSLKNGLSAEVKQKLAFVKDSIVEEFPVVDNPYLKCFMLCRILPYCRSTNDKKFLIERIISTWT